MFKTQVFQLAKYLGVPSEICKRIPTTDTYSAEQTQEEFFFRLPFEILDKVWLGLELNWTTDKIANDLNLKPEQVENIITDIKKKKSTTEYLRMNPI